AAAGAGRSAPDWFIHNPRRKPRSPTAPPNSISTEPFGILPRSFLPATKTVGDIDSGSGRQNQDFSPNHNLTSYQHPPIEGGDVLLCRRIFAPCAEFLSAA